LIALYKFLFLKYINFCLFTYNNVIKKKKKLFCKDSSSKPNKKIYNYFLNKELINYNNMLINTSVNTSYLLKYFFIFSQLNFIVTKIKLNIVKKRFYLYVLFLLNFLKINYSFYLYRFYKLLKLSKFNFKYLFKRSVNNKYISFKANLTKNYYYQKGILFSKKNFQYLNVLSDFLVRQRLL
jgi:hypothetical protein